MITLIYPKPARRHSFQRASEGTAQRLISRSVSEWKKVLDDWLFVRRQLIKDFVGCSQQQRMQCIGNNDIQCRPLVSKATLTSVYCADI